MHLASSRPSKASSRLASFAVRVLLSATAALSIVWAAAPEGLAKTTKHSHSTTSHSATSSHHSSRHGHAAAAIASSKSGRRIKGGRSGGRAVAHRGRHHHAIAHHEAKTKHAYALGMFIKSPPPFDSSPPARG
jgi:hypothetical protein